MTARKIAGKASASLVEASHAATAASPARGDSVHWPAHPPANKLLHELQVQQIELEMQNETLRQSQIALEASRDRYIDFYDFSPVGFLTLSDKGLIEEINLTGAAMLGMPRGQLLQRRFDQVVAAADGDRWHRYFISALQQDAKLSCDLALSRPDGSPLEVRIDSLCVCKEGKTPLLRVVVTDMTQSKRAEEDLRTMASSLETKVLERTKQLRALSAELTMTEERERGLLAQDLHDNLAQLLAVIKIRLTSLVPGVLQPSIDRIVKLVDETEQSARTVMLQLSPPILHTLGLTPALEWLGDEIERVYGVSVNVDSDDRGTPFGIEMQGVMYRSARELLINVAKHAGVTQASISCLCDDGRLALAVSDAGCGFDASDCPAAWPTQHGFGLRSIYERITNLGGKMQIDSKPGRGTTVTLLMPFPCVAEELPK